MKTSGLIIFSFLSSALAAPAVVWKSSRQTDRVLHTSDNLHASELLADALNVERKDSSLAAVVFLLGKGEDGSETLTEMASSGMLPNVANKYNDAEAIHHHVGGIESTDNMVYIATRANSGHSVVQVDMNELNSKLESCGQPSKPVEMEIGENGLVTKAMKDANKRAKKMANSNVLIVKINSNEDAAAIDSAVVNAIDSECVDNVVLAGIRSMSEVKHERYLMAKHRQEIMEVQGRRILQSRRRKLDEEQDGDEDVDDYEEADMTGVYYVSLTPNIFAGLLFFFMFSFVAWIGLSCMGMIQGQEVYVSKMPSIGREA